MDIHVCKQCGSHFMYCRKCVFRPIPYKDAGFCSKECYEASKNQVVESEITNEIVEVEQPNQIDEVIQDVAPIEEKVEVETIVSAEASSIEMTETDKPIIKKETSNTYKNKKNKYSKVHE